ncbi:unnamed protein product [Symbiodinium sp. KB8]|nr:unnamed protein product [Symbiodinium sp. KB8]
MAARKPKVANPSSLIEYHHLRFLIIDAPTDANISAYVDEVKRNNVVTVVRACEPTYDPAPFTAAGIAEVKASLAKGRKDPKATIAVHCVAGLGRAPVLVAVALVEEGLQPLEAVELIRSKRRGAINQSQLKYLQHEYTPRGGGCCTIQ